jgi:pimeloyl-ACP methyl ester carboxylesterase
MSPYSSVLPPGIRSRIVPGINGLNMHVLEAGYPDNDSTPQRPAILLLHGFPELAFSWRKVMLPLAQAGYHVIAPDQRGYGRTTGWSADYDGALEPFRVLNLVRDALGLVVALGHSSVAAVVGHDFGSPVAAWCALLRPDVFRACVLMSSPFGGPPSLPVPAVGVDHATLAVLPRPRKHYQAYYGTCPANADMQQCPQGVHAFLRAYYHVKSADWAVNQPHALASYAATEMAKMPTYYIMDADQTMAQTVAPHAPSATEAATCAWLTEPELTLYAAEYQRNGFQGGLQWYRCGAEPRFITELQTWAGRSIDVPSMFIAGQSDWGTYQKPGEFEKMQRTACTDMRSVHLVEGAGHWVQQEQPVQVMVHLLEFLRGVKSKTAA